MSQAFPGSVGDLPGPQSRPLLHSRSFPARAEIAFQSLTVRELFSGASYTYWG